jgi:hypothetical protein
MMVTDFRTGAIVRARSRDPAITPASCREPTLQSSDPAARTIITDTLQRANARSYADAYVVSLFLDVATLLLAFVCAFALPRPRTQRQ